MSVTTQHLYEFGSFRLDTRERLLLRDGQRVKLEGKAFESLLVLVRNSGRVVPKNDFMNQVWGDTVVEENNIEKSISALRKALGENGSELQFIETVRGLGYRFVAEVRELDPDLSTLVRHESRRILTIEDEEIELADNPVPFAEMPTVMSKGRRKIIIAAGATVLVLAAVTGFYFRSANAPKPTINSIAVMPFVNVSNDPETEYLSDGISESLINSLSQLPDMKMIARSSLLRFKGKEVDPQVVGRELNVQAILTGRVVQQGEMLTISAELVDTQNNTHLWGERYERKVSDLLVMQREIASEISSQLRVKLSGAERSRVTRLYTEDAAAYQLYLKGRFYWNKRTNEGVRKSIEYFSQAIEADPGYALAYAGLADSYVLQGGFFVSHPAKEAYPKAKEAAVKALALDDQLAEAHTSLAMVRLQYDWNWPDAEREFKQAIALNPNYPTAHHWYAFYFATRGRFDEAVAEIKRAQELDPVSLIINTDAGAILFLAGRYDPAIVECQKALELDPTFSQAHVILSLVYEQREMYDQWLAERQKALTVSGKSDEAARLGLTYAHSGHRGVVENWLSDMKEHAKSQYVPAFAMARAYADLGDKDHAFEWLEKAYEERSPRMSELREIPVLKNLRSDPRFTELEHRIGL